MSSVKSVQPWCSLSTLIIWNRNLRSERDHADSKADNVAGVAPEEAADTDDLLLFLSLPEEVDAMRKKRKLGLAQGLIDFTR